MITKIKEIFESVQGEGLSIGQKQLFIRFPHCNLHCNYCDTNHTDIGAKNFSEEELFDIINKSNAASVSLTGGEPLLNTDFLKSFLERYKKYLKKEIYLETNGTLYKELEQIIDFVDIIAMDIKIKSATGEDNQFILNDKFLNIAKKKVFIKTVFGANITDYEIQNVANLAKKYNVPLVLQPKNPIDKNMRFLPVYNKFYSLYKNVRLIPQVHKFLHIK